jgi:hypothetical protein
MAGSERKKEVQALLGGTLLHQKRDYSVLLPRVAEYTGLPNYGDAGREKGTSEVIPRGIQKKY